MVGKITRGILEGFLNCRYKAYLQLRDHAGSRTEYERMLIAAGEDLTQKVELGIRERCSADGIIRDACLSTATLREGAMFILNSHLEDDAISIRFDGLKKILGPSALGDFHYIPMLFHEGRRVRKEQRVLLEMLGILLSRLQGRQPEKGLVWYGSDCKTTTIRLNLDLRSTERRLREVSELVNAEASPRLIINNHCQACEFRDACTKQAEQADDLSLLRGIREKEIERFARKGIFSVTQLAHTFRPKRGKRASTSTHRYHALQALAVRDRRVYVLGTPQLPDPPVQVYIDVEGNPDERFNYLIGMIVVEGKNEHQFSFWADTPDQEERIVEQLLGAISPYPELVVFAYGSYEASFLQRMLKRQKTREPLQRVLDNLINILSIIYSHLYFPTYSNGLKDIAGFLGSSWTHPDASGLQSLVWRTQWEKTHAPQLKQQLVTYNQEDCEALRRVTEFIYAQDELPNSASPSPGTSGVPHRVTSVDEIDRLGTINERGRKQFFHTDFDYINSCARFDYQRERVYVRARTRGSMRKGRKPRKYRNCDLRVSRRVDITAQVCPLCSSSELTRLPKGLRGCSTRRKRAFDLVFSTVGIKRSVIECRASVHQCEGCGHCFVPERYKRLAKHFHGLMSWAMQQHVAHRVGCPIVAEMVKEYFGFTLYPQEVWRFRSMMARYYKPCYDTLLRTILSGTVVQIDETEVKLRTGRAFVWVFTTPEYVVYMHRPSREGSFLKDLLMDFDGVLVSDFYGAYDSLECRQQKCLIHLIRDMNQELLNNPFDEELQSITAPFGMLLRSVVATIDQYGLKHRHLKKHRRDVAKFFRAVTAQTFRSETAESLRARLLKNQDSLFTFIEFDGIPWNNNNSENAIRRFAYYRDSNPGRMKEAGLQEYLVLLSLCQTCHYKGVSFLKFMLSREQNIDAFCHRPKTRRPSPEIEVYPEGVVRPDFQRRRVADDVELE